MGQAYHPVHHFRAYACERLPCPPHHQGPHGEGPDPPGFVALESVHLHACYEHMSPAMAKCILDAGTDPPRSRVYGVKKKANIWPKKKKKKKKKEKFGKKKKKKKKKKK